MRLFTKEIMLYDAPKGWSVARQPLSQSHTYRSITFGKGEFVAASRTKVFSSSDTFTWEENSSAWLSRDVQKLIFDGTYFIAMTKSGDTKTTTDLEQWGTALGLSSSYNWIDIIYDGSNCIALSEEGYISVTSNIRTTSWSTPYKLQIPVPNHFLCLSFNNDKIIAFATNGFTSVSLDNGDTWSIPTKNNTITSNFDTVIYANKFIAIAGVNVFESTDGDTWVDLGENVNLKDVGTWVSMTKNDNTLVAITDDGYISTKRI